MEIGTDIARLWQGLVLLSVFMPNETWCVLCKKAAKRVAKLLSWAKVNPCFGHSGNAVMEQCVNDDGAIRDEEKVDGEIDSVVQCLVYWGPFEACDNERINVLLFQNNESGRPARPRDKNALHKGANIHDPSNMQMNTILMSILATCVVVTSSIVPRHPEPQTGRGGVEPPRCRDPSGRHC
ncbi:hypothetical protein DFH28DRAFT_1103605 [Melampsora americana]|nr:hypothetical protein DFH28DRAFT_1103605 [Melampsora americana]